MSELGESKYHILFLLISFVKAQETHSFVKEEVIKQNDSKWKSMLASVKDVLRVDKGWDDSVEVPHYHPINL